MSAVRARVLIIPAIVVLLAAARQEPSAEELVAKAADYLHQYSAKVSGVSLDELFLLTETSTGVNRVPQRIASDVVLIKVEEQLLGLRDEYSVDTKALREHKPRIIEALSNPTEANWELTQKYVREHANYLLNNVVVWYSDPMLAFQFVSPDTQDKLIYRIEGSKKLNGVLCYGLGFKEKPDDESRVFDHIPGHAHSSGRLWIDPATGAIHATDLWVVSDTDNVRMAVQFAPDAKLGLLLPKSAAHTFEWREAGKSTLNAVTGTLQKATYEANAVYKDARYTPIDLNRR
jgi:hypothetical protein